MKVVRYLMLAGMLLAGSTALAQEPERPRERQRDRPARRQALRATYEAVLAQLNLDAAQQARTKQILDTNTQDMNNWNKQYAEDLGNLQRQRAQAREQKDEKKLALLDAEVAKINKEREKLQDRLHGQLLEVLKGEQNEKFVLGVLGNRRLQMSQGRRIRLALKVIALDKTQQEKAGKIVDAAEAEAAKITDRRQQGAPLRRAVEELKTKVLMDEAKSKKLDQLLQAGRRGFLAGLNLSAEQQKKADDILAAARQAEDRRGAMREAMEKIRNEVLTEQQREQLDRQQQERRRDRTRPERPAAE